MCKKATSFKAMDGERFDTEELARFHDRFVAFSLWYADHTIYIDILERFQYTPERLHISVEYVESWLQRHKCEVLKLYGMEEK